MNPALSAEYSRDELTALYLYKILSYINWPESSFSHDDSPFIYCIENQKIIITSLRLLAAGKRIKDRPIHIIAPQTKADFSSCHIVYFSQESSEISLLTESGEYQKNRLLIGGGVDYLSLPVMIIITEKEERLKISIKKGLLDKSSLKVSANLLRIATILP